MQENFLHYIWRTRRFDRENLTTTNDTAVEILDFGEYNVRDAGADFQNARIKIGDVLWAGAVEMHIRTSDWLRHGHQRDAAYRNVILHVVFENDLLVSHQNSLEKTQNTEGVVLLENDNFKTENALNDVENLLKTPCLELKMRIPSGIFQNYWALQHSETWIPCARMFPKVATLTKDLWLERLLVERLERKSAAISTALEHNRGDWEETFWQFVARYFGSKVNAEPMEILARSLPHRTLAKHKNQRFQIEALLFGTAGFLTADFADDYPKRLKKEFDFLQKKHNLKVIPLGVTAWKFSRLRPASFPTVRLAQLSALIHASSHLFSKVIDNQSIASLKNLFLAAEATDYWQTHFVFDKSIDAEKSVFPKKMGDETVNMILINVVAPFLFFYGKSRKDDDLKERAFALLSDLKCEKNIITEGWKLLDVPLESAARGQALIQLKTEYCDRRRCLECAIGNKILSF